MFQELVSYLFQQNADAKRAETEAAWRFEPLGIDGHDPKAVPYVKPNGGLATWPVNVAIRDAELDSIASLAHYIKAYGDDAAEIYIAARNVTVYLAGFEAYDTAVLPLAKTQEFLAIETLQNKRQFSQVELLDFLKVDLAGPAAGPDVANLITSIRSITFRSTDEGRSEFSNSGADIARSTAALDGVELPETFDAACRIDAPVFVLPEIGRVVATVRAHLSVDVMAQQFTLKAEGDSVARARLTAREAIALAIRDECGEGAAVFLGSMR